MNSDAELSSKTTTVEASKQANAAFISAIQALKLVERDATDGAVTTAFNDQYQTLLTQTPVKVASSNTLFSGLASSVASNALFCSSNVRLSVSRMSWLLFLLKVWL
jgi:hypothetical protein